MKTKIFLILILTFVPGLLFAQFTQQGPKLVGSNGLFSFQGVSVAVSADGNTVIEGGYYDNIDTGAVWVFTRSNGVWLQQGQKLIGTGAIGGAYQGISVAISSDGNTAVVGGSGDNDNSGAVWVFTRSGSVWSQQGPRLIGTGSVDTSLQGNQVAVSSDGNTFIEGGFGDNHFAGAVWIFTRSGNIWSQQGPKLVGTGAIGAAEQGASLGISGDGNTAVVGGHGDNGHKGAVWVFTRNNGVWTQMGTKLVGTNGIGNSFQGTSSAISSDGNTIIEGGDNDNSYTGALWVFTRSGSVWSQQGPKLIGTGATGNGGQGYSVAASSDGNIFIEGAPNDNNDSGSVWVFKRNDGVWSQLGSKLYGTGAVISPPEQGISIAVNSDGNTLVTGGYYDYSGTGSVWVFYNPTIGITQISTNTPSKFSLEQNYPNPFNPNSKIKFEMPKYSATKLIVFDILGREVATLVNENLNPGTYEADFDGGKLSSGIYFYVLKTENYTETKKMVLVK